MEQYLINDETLNGIADAIREKEGAFGPLYPQEMPDAIRAIPTGGGDPNERYFYHMKNSYQNGEFLYEDYIDDWYGFSTPFRLAGSHKILNLPNMTKLYPAPFCGKSNPPTIEDYELISKTCPNVEKMILGNLSVGVRLASSFNYPSTLEQGFPFNKFPKLKYLEINLRDGGADLCNFSEMPSLEKLIIQSTVTEYQDYFGRTTFYGSSKLTEVILGTNVNSLFTSVGWEYGLFENCQSLKTVTLLNETRVVNYSRGITFRNCPNLESIYVPDNIYDEYILRWSEYRDKIKKLSEKP